MLKNITLKNFQCHKDLRLDFEPGVNSIVGASDKGKSSVLRGLQWVAFNRPSGDTFMTHGTKEVEVTIETEDHTVKRIKNNKRNGYDVNGEQLNAIGRDIPELVQTALNLQEINFQSQFENAFLLSETSGEVGKQLNQLVDLSIIDTTLTALNSQNKNCTKKISFLEESEKKQHEIVKQYKDFTKAKKALDDLTTKEQMFKLNMRRSLELENILKAYLTKQKSVEGLGRITESLAAIEVMEKQQENLSQIRSKYVTFSAFVSKMRDKQKVVTRLNDVDAAGERYTGLTILWESNRAHERRAEDLSRFITLTQSASNALRVLAPTSEALEALEALKQRYGRRQERLGRQETLSQAMNKVQQKSEKVGALSAEIVIMEQEHKELYGDNCPLCGHSMDS